MKTVAFPLTLSGEIGDGAVLKKKKAYAKKRAAELSAVAKRVKAAVAAREE